MPQRLRRPLVCCAAGELPPNVALMQLLASSRNAEEAKRTLRAAAEFLERDGRPGAAARIRDAAILLREIPDAYATVTAMLEVEQKSTKDVRGIAALFDRAAAVSPEASVALYCLGDRGLLAAATDEIITRMEVWGLLADPGLVLEIGCGIGRFLDPVAARVRHVCGTDVSHRMLEIARARVVRRNVSVVRTSGRDLAPFASRSADLIYAIDTFPYLERSGTATTHIGEAARVLKPGGSLLIINYSYCGDLGHDRSEIARAATQAQLDVRLNGLKGFGLWDGAAYHLVRSQ